MKILVTGSSGTIGTRLCERLLSEGHEVVGVDWVKNKWQPAVDALTVRADLRDKTQLEQVTGNIDAIVHLAANARVYELVEHPDRALDNFVTLFNALEFARTRGIKRFIFASSRESYGNIDSGQMKRMSSEAGLVGPASEDSAEGKGGSRRENRGFSTSALYREDMVRVENCESPYTASKVGGEALVESYKRCYGIDAIILRFSNVYGMYDDSERVVPLFIRRAKVDEPLTVFGADKCLDFTYIDDCVDGITRCLTQFDAAKNDTYNIAYGEGTTIVRLAEMIKGLLGSSSPIEMGKPRTGEVIRYVADISKAKKVLGYDPKTPFAEGVKKAVEWYGKA